MSSMRPRVIKICIAVVLVALVAFAGMAAARYYVFREPMRLFYSAYYADESVNDPVQTTLIPGLYVFDTAAKSVCPIQMPSYSELSDPFLTENQTILCTAVRTSDASPCLLEITENEVVRAMVLPFSQPFGSPVMANGEVFVYAQGVIYKCVFATAQVDAVKRGLEETAQETGSLRPRVLFSDGAYLVYAKIEQNSRKWFAYSVLKQEEVFLSDGADCAGFSEPGKVWITEENEKKTDERRRIVQVDVQDGSVRTRTHKRYLYPHHLNEDFWTEDYATGYFSTDYFSMQPVVFDVRLVHKKTGMKKAWPEMLSSPDGKDLTVMEMIDLGTETAPRGNAMPWSSD